MENETKGKKKSKDIKEKGSNKSNVDKTKANKKPVKKPKNTTTKNSKVEKKPTQTKKSGGVKGTTKKKKSSKGNNGTNTSYNRVTLKQSFFSHESRKVSERYRDEFRKQKGSKRMNRYFSQKTKGRKQEKQERQEEQLNKAKEELSKDLSIDINGLLLSKKAVLLIVNKRLLLGEHLDGKELKTLWEIIKVELGEPTSVSKNQNNNTDMIKNLGDNHKLYDDEPAK